jgi:hypothetical protein
LKAPFSKLILADNCTWTPWFNSDTTIEGTGDIETLEMLFKTFGVRSCLVPTEIQARSTKTGEHVKNNKYPQEYSKYDTTTGFVCRTDEQGENEICHDYEVRLCCPGRNLGTFLMNPF